MKLGVMADTHNNISIIEKAVARFNEMDVTLVVHAGDFRSPYAIEPLADLNCLVFGVFGNNDLRRERELTKAFEGIGTVTPSFRDHGCVTHEDRKIAVTHYPEIAIPIAESGTYDIVVYGHTHRIKHQVYTHTDSEKSETLLLNPGATGSKRARCSTAAVVDLETLFTKIYRL